MRRIIDRMVLVLLGILGALILIYLWLLINAYFGVW